jgi:hypothetical protein
MSRVLDIDLIKQALPASNEVTSTDNYSSIQVVTYHLNKHSIKKASVPQSTI